MAAGNHGWVERSHSRIGTGAAALLCALLAACLAACAGDEPSSPGGGRPTVNPPIVGVPGAGASGAAGLVAGGGGGAQPGMAGSLAAGGGGSPNTGGGGAGGAAGRAGGGAGGLGGAGMTGGAGAGGSTEPGPPGEICARWKADRADLTESPWTGDAATCTAGDMTEEDRATAHRLVNLYRFMAGLEPVMMTAEGNRLAQGCALLMGANSKISHTPDSTWKCFTEESAKTAGASSLSSGGSISSVDGYMIDPGNPTTIGHRRWILSNMLSSIGFGSAGRFSCQYQPAQRAPATAKAWAAWPPPGQVPIQALGSRFAKIDMTGWTVQSDRISLNGAQVAVTSGGMDMPVTVTALLPGYGSSFALRFNPMGWAATAGQTYSVKLSGTPMPIEYEVQVVDCP